MLNTFESDTAMLSPRQRSTAPLRFNGPERRCAGGSSSQWVPAILDEFDFGVLTLDAQGRVIHLNHVARAEMDINHPLTMIGNELRCRLEADAPQWRSTVDGVIARGLRKLLWMGPAGHAVSVSVVPVSQRADPHGPAAVVMFGKRKPYGEFAIQAYAISHRLTSSETRVLSALCEGSTPADVALQRGVAISTVRTQVARVLEKTGAASIGMLMRRVASLPPLVSVLR